METMRTSETIGALAEALAKARTEFREVAKTGHYKQGPLKGQRYTLITDVLDAVTPALSKHGLAIVQGPVSTEALATRLIHSSGEWMEATAPIVQGQQPGAQGWGSGVTYARKYALMAMVGVFPDDDASRDGVRDDDGAAANGSAPRKLSQRAAVAEPRMTPEQYATGLTTAIQSADRDGLSRLLETNARPLDKLQEEHPQLYKRVESAIAEAEQMHHQAPPGWPPPEKNGAAHGH